MHILFVVIRHQCDPTTTTTTMHSCDPYKCLRRLVMTVNQRSGNNHFHCHGGNRIVAKAATRKINCSWWNVHLIPTRMTRTKQNENYRRDKSYKTKHNNSYCVSVIGNGYQISRTHLFDAFRGDSKNRLLNVPK